MKRSIQIIVMALLVPVFLKAQDGVSQKLYSVNRVFDSAYFLQFNIKFIYNSDTLYGKFDKRERAGKYIISKNNFYYQLGDVEFMQNDTFAFSVFHSDQTMLLSKRSMESALGTLPLKQFLDSCLAQYRDYFHVNILVDETEEEETIEFVADSANMPYDKFSITYDISSYYPSKIEFQYREMEAPYQNEDDSIQIEQEPVLRKKTMTILFTDYKFADTDLSLFNEENYVLFDSLRRRFIPAEKYKKYILRVSGMEDYEDLEFEENRDVEDH
jgi:hypothetical protein